MHPASMQHQAGKSPADFSAEQAPHWSPGSEACRGDRRTNIFQAGGPAGHVLSAGFHVIADVKLQIATAALDPRTTCPACGPAWKLLHGGHGPMRLIDLDDVLPDPWRVQREQAQREHLETDPYRR
jgi:hypothetical protein